MIKHRFVTTAPDGSDTSKLRPSDWNDSHVIEDRSILGEHLDLGTEFGQINTDVVPEGVVNKYKKATILLAVMYLENGETVSLAVGAPVYFYDVNIVKRGQANISTTKDIIGLVRGSVIAVNGKGFIQTGGVLAATVSEWVSITGQAGGLIPNALYYLSPYTPGKLTPLVPSVSGQYAVEIGRALNSTELDINIKPSVVI